MDWNNLFSKTAWGFSGFVGIMGLIIGAKITDWEPLSYILGLGLFLATWFWLLSRGAHLICPLCSEDVKANAVVCPHCGRDMYRTKSRELVAPGRSQPTSPAGSFPNHP